MNKRPKQQTTFSLWLMGASLTLVAMGCQSSSSQTKEVGRKDAVTKPKVLQGASAAQQTAKNGRKSPRPSIRETQIQGQSVENSPFFAESEDPEPVYDIAPQNRVNGVIDGGNGRPSIHADDAIARVRIGPPCRRRVIKAGPKEGSTVEMKVVGYSYDTQTCRLVPVYEAQRVVSKGPDPERRELERRWRPKLKIALPEPDQKPQDKKPEPIEKPRGELIHTSGH